MSAARGANVARQAQPPMDLSDDERRKITVRSGARTQIDRKGRSRLNRLFVPSVSLALLIVAGGIFAFGGAAQATASDQQVLMADLSGANEVPGPGDAAGWGTVMISVNMGDSTMCVDGNAADISLPLTGAHIHEAAAGVAGSIVVPFIGGGGPLPPSPDAAFTGCTSVDAALLQSIWDNPQNYYFNVHNADFPPGAIRGQLTK